MRDNKHALKPPLFYDLLWVGGITLVALAVFILASYTIKSFYREQDYSTYIHNLKNSIEKKLEIQLSILKAIETRISSVSRLQYEEKIPSLLKEDYKFIAQDSLDVSSTFNEKYFLSKGNTDQLIASHGKITHPEIVLKGVNLKAASFFNGKYFLIYTQDELFLGLCLRPNDYVFIKSLKASLLGKEESHNSVIINIQDIKHIYKRSLKAREILRSPLVYQGKSFKSYIYFSQLGTVILLSGPQPYTLKDYFQQTIWPIIFIFFLGMLFVLYLLVAYRRIETRISQRYETRIQSLQNDLKNHQVQSNAYKEQNEDLKASTNQWQHMFQSLCEFLGRFQQLSSESQKISQMFVRDLSGRMISRLTPEEHLKLSAKIYDNSNHIMSGMINVSDIVKCSLESIITKSLAMCSHLISKKNIHVDLDLTHCVKDAYTDETLILQIFYNIIYKIIDRLPQRGTIKLKMSESRLFHSLALSLSIEDDGYIWNDKDFEAFKAKEHQSKFKLYSNPLNLSWDDIEVLIKNAGGQLTKNASDTKINRLELKIPVRLEDSKKKSSSSNVVSLRGDHVK